jgi:phage terminase large subunit
VVFDPQGINVEWSSDIGFHDTASWWLWQRRIKGFALLGYVGDSGMDADDWAPELQGKMKEWGVPLERLGKIWLPPDAKAKTFQSKHTTVERFIAKFGAQHIGVIPPSKKADQISSARDVIDRCEFHKERCGPGNSSGTRTTTCSPASHCTTGPHTLATVLPTAASACRKSCRRRRQRSLVISRSAPAIR